MGFTVYWYPVATDIQTLKKFGQDLRRVIRYSHIVEGPDYLELHDIEGACESFLVSERPRGSSSMHFCKTSRREFTYDVMAAVILMSHYKMVSEFGNDDEKDFPFDASVQHIRNFLPELNVGACAKDIEIQNLKNRIEHLEQQLADARLFAQKILSATR